MSRRDQQPDVPAMRGGSPAEELLFSTFDALRDELLTTLLFVLGNREDAKDAAQEAFVKCWNARQNLDSIVNLRAWIFRVGFNAAKDIQRSAWHRRVKPMRAEQYALTSHEAGPDQTLERREAVESLRRAILELRQEEKEVFLLRQNGELTYEQIAELRSCPVGTIKTQMRAALEKLRRTMATV